MLKAIKGWLRHRAARREQEAVDARNVERRALCAEYPHADQARRGAIIARIVELNGEADIRGAVERIGYELDGICRRTAQADVIRRVPPAPQAHDHFQSNLRQFRRDHCGMVEDDACPSGEVKA